MIFETHAHLCDSQFDSDRAQVIDHAFSSGISALVEIADIPDDWQKVQSLTQAYPGRIFASLGLHPYYASRLNDDLIKRWDQEIKKPEVVAIGEIGLDYAKSPEPKEIQIATFEKLLEKTLEWDKPCVIHCREAYEDLLSILKKQFPKPPTHKRFWGVIHCFSGTEKDALECVEFGFALGVDGPVTYPKNNSLRQTFQKIGPGFLVLETDSPYLPPQSRRGKRNEPACLIEIAQKLSESLGISFEKLAQKTTQNACGLYGVQIEKIS